MFEKEHVKDDEPMGSEDDDHSKKEPLKLHRRYNNRNSINLLITFIMVA